MWVPRYTGAPRAMLRRTLLMLVTPFLVACFFILGPLSTISFANPGTWAGDDLIFDGETYTLAPDEAPDIPNRTAYQWIDTEPSPDKAYLIFFSSEEEVTEQATASRVAYNYNPPDSYTSPSDPETVDIRNDLLEEEGVGSDVGSNCDGSIFSGLGWILCPMTNWLAGATDNMYGLVKDFLEVPAATADTDTGLYTLWATIRTVANICFVIVFLAIIYAQITSIGISNYSIKTMLPRLIIGAVLVNISFWLSALAIDISNVLGHSVYAIFDNVRQNMTPAIHVDWSGLTAFILSGGAIVGSLGFIAATGGAITGLGFLLISALASVAFGIFVAFVVLAARQALLTVLLLLSPLAFVAFVLPGTQSLFDRWRKSFVTLLMFFPLFALLFGGSAVASLAIMNNADGLLHIVVIGLAVQVVPLVITPFLIQFSTGLLGRIAGMASSKHGLVDRTKGWARENAEYHKDRALGQDRTVNPFKMGARALNRRKIQNNRKREGYKDAAEADARQGREMDWRRLRRNPEVTTRRGWSSADNFARERSLDKESALNSDERNWQRRINTDQPLYERYQAAHHNQFEAERYKSSNDTSAKLHSQRTLDARDSSFDRSLYKAAIDQVEDESQTTNLETNFNAIVEEMKAGTNPYADSSVPREVKARLGGAAAISDLTRQVDNLSSLNIEGSLEGSRKQMAEKRQETVLAKHLKANLSDRVYAGGIDPNGATKVYASAVETMSSDHMKTVVAQTSVFSNEGYDVNQLDKVVRQGVLRDGTSADDYHIHAAMSQIVTKGGNMDVSRLADYVASQGMRASADGKTYTTLDGQVLAADSSEVADRRDLHQMFKEFYVKGNKKISTISGGDLGAMETGTFTADNLTTPKSTSATIRDMKTIKFNQERWLNEDVDVLQRHIMVLRDGGNRQAIGEPQRQELAQQIKSTFANPDNERYLKGREGQLLQVIQRYLELDPDTTPPADIEDYYISTEDKSAKPTTIKAPSDSNYDFS